MALMRRLGNFTIYNDLKRHGLHEHYDAFGDIEKYTRFKNPLPSEHSLEVWTGNEAN